MGELRGVGVGGSMICMDLEFVMGWVYWEVCIFFGIAGGLVRIYVEGCFAWGFGGFCMLRYRVGKVVVRDCIMMLRNRLRLEYRIRDLYVNSFVYEHSLDPSTFPYSD